MFRKQLESEWYVAYRPHTICIHLSTTNRMIVIQRLCYRGIEPILPF